MTDTNAAIAVYDNHSEAEDAVKELQKSGFDMKKLSVVGKDYHTDEHVVGYYNAEDRMKYWGKQGAFWGGFWGLLFGAAFFWVPAIGPVLVGGPLVAWIVAGLEDAVLVGGLSALGAGLYSIGIPKDSIVTYEAAIKAGEYLVVAHGTSAEAAKAREILSKLKPLHVADHVLEPTTQPATVWSHREVGSDPTSSLPSRYFGQKNSMDARAQRESIRYGWRTNSSEVAVSLG